MLLALEILLPTPPMQIVGLFDGFPETTNYRLLVILW